MASRAATVGTIAAILAATAVGEEAEIAAQEMIVVQDPVQDHVDQLPAAHQHVKAILQYAQHALPAATSHAQHLAHHVAHSLVRNHAHSPARSLAHHVALHAAHKSRVV